MTSYRPKHADSDNVRSIPISFNLNSKPQKRPWKTFEFNNILWPGGCQSCSQQEGQYYLGDLMTPWPGWPLDPWPNPSQEGYYNSIGLQYSLLPRQGDLLASWPHDHLSRATSWPPDPQGGQADPPGPCLPVWLLHWTGKQGQTRKNKDNQGQKRTKKEQNRTNKDKKGQVLTTNDN